MNLNSNSLLAPHTAFGSVRLTSAIKFLYQWEKQNLAWCSQSDFSELCSAGTGKSQSYRHCYQDEPEL